jgi:hypothetical protein
MSSKLKDIKPILADLKKSLTEEEILKHLILLVKGFDPHQYREVIYKNPYYKSLIPDIQKDIIEDLEKISFSITKEIEIIESDLKKIGSKDSEKELKNLKKDCLSLIYEIDERKKEIDSLSKFTI